MLKVLEIADLPDVGQVQLCLKIDGQGAGEGHAVPLLPPVAFETRLKPGDHQEIGWYFQHYLERPFGDAKVRAAAVESRLRNLGRSLFELVFNSSEAAKAVYAAAVAEGLSNHELSVISPRLEFLSLPWELLNEPRSGYLAAQLAGISRRSSPELLAPYPDLLPTDQFNVLLVSPSPVSDEGDAPRSMAPVVVKVLESLDVTVELDFLRPPTLAALEEWLAKRPAHYHVVQFDGVTASGPGLVRLEKPDNTADPIPAQRLAGLLAEARVPAVLVNTGDAPSGRKRSDYPERESALVDAGALGPVDSTQDRLKAEATEKDVWAQISAQLVAGGAPLAVTLPHPLPGSAQEHFLRSFYQALARGTTASTAVAVARRSLMNNPHRDSPAGKLPFWDWAIPMVYQSRSYVPIAIEKPPAKPLPVEPQATEAEQKPSIQLPAEGPFGLVGRQREVRRLERLLQQKAAVFLTGTTGVGKTELALGLARWLQKTGERPGGVFYSSFEIGAGLVRVVHEIGTAVAGLDFADLDAAQQRQWALDYLCQQPCLLIWDALEGVAGFPTGAPGLLDADERAELDSFLAQVLKEGKSQVLLVSRREELWISVPHLSMELQGLDRRNRLELSFGVLEKASIEPADRGPEYLELLDLLAGHPLAMQIALPILKQLPASALLPELAKTLEHLPTPAAEAGRDPWLTAAMEYSFGRMTHRGRTHLPFLALFQRRVMMDVLTHITQEKVYRSVMGEELGWGACRTLLRSARDAGFLEGITPSVYQIHPAFPWFYGRKLQRQAPATGLRRLESEFMRVYADTADYFMETLSENPDNAVTAVLAEEGNLTQALGLAVEAKEWDQAQVIVQPIAQVLRMQKRFPELRRLRRQLLQSVGLTAAQAEANNAVELWLYLIGTEANEATDLLDLDRAEELNRQLLDYLTSRPTGATDPRTAAVYHQLGVIALHRRQLAQSEEWLLRSLAIIKDAEDRAAAGDDYYYLGLVKQQQRDYDQAKERFSQALEVHQRLQDQEELIKDYRALGRLAHLRLEYKEAESWYHRAREVVEELQDEETAVQVFHQLGTIYHAQQMFDDAERWYSQALTLSDRLGLTRQMAIEFHHLGLLTHNAELFEDAENWYQLAREQYENLGDRRATGDECRQLGVLFHEWKRLDEAEQWYDRARQTFEEIQDPQRLASTCGQLGIVSEEKGLLIQALEWAALAYGLSVDHHLPLINQAKAHLSRLRDKHGRENFTHWWQGSGRGELPLE